MYVYIYIRVPVDLPFIHCSFPSTVFPADESTLQAFDLLGLLWKDDPRNGNRMVFHGFSTKGLHFMGYHGIHCHVENFTDDPSLFSNKPEVCPDYDRSTIPATYYPGFGIVKETLKLIKKDRHCHRDSNNESMKKTIQKGKNTWLENSNLVTTFQTDQHKQVDTTRAWLSHSPQEVCPIKKYKVRMLPTQTENEQNHINSK